MQKLMLTLTVALVFGLGNLYAQTTPTPDSKSSSTEVKKKTPEMRKAIAVDQAKSKVAAGAKIKDSKPAKDNAQASQIRDSDATKEGIKSHAAEDHADQKHDAQKEKIAAHKDEIKLHTDSKEEAKAKIKRKQDKHKGE